MFEYYSRYISVLICLFRLFQLRCLLGHAIWMPGHVPALVHRFEFPSGFIHSILPSIA